MLHHHTPQSLLSSLQNSNAADAPSSLPLSSLPIFVLEKTGTDDNRGGMDKRLPGPSLYAAAFHLPKASLRGAVINLLNKHRATTDFPARGQGGGGGSSARTMQIDITHFLKCIPGFAEFFSRLGKLIAFHCHFRGFYSAPSL